MIIKHKKENENELLQKLFPLYLFWLRINGDLKSGSKLIYEKVECQSRVNNLSFLEGEIGFEPPL